MRTGSAGRTVVDMYGEPSRVPSSVGMTLWVIPALALGTTVCLPLALQFMFRFLFPLPRPGGMLGPPPQGSSALQCMRVAVCGPFASLLSDDASGGTAGDLIRHMWPHHCSTTSVA